MRKIYSVGETVLDIIFKDGYPQAAKAGGSMLNSVVSLGRTGLPVFLISESGNDDVGDLIDSFLKKNGVDTTYVTRFNDANTSLALAFLNETNDATYTFYKNYHPGKENKAYPETGQGDILLCGSFYSIWQELRPQFRKLITGAKENGSLVIYDPNIRKSHLIKNQDFRPVIIENMEASAIVRGSHEDFEYIFGTGNADETYDLIRSHCNILVYTSSKDGVFVRTPSISENFPVKKINPVSTIGAGDNFNAGMIACLYRKNISRESLNLLDKDEWAEIAGTAVSFATHVCLSYENYISVEFAEAFNTGRSLT